MADGEHGMHATVDVVLERGTAPRILVRTCDEMIEAVVERPRGKHGTLFYQAFGTCPGATVLTWTRVASNHIPAGCSMISRWTIVAGWLDQPVSTLDYRSP